MGWVTLDGVYFGDRPYLCIGRGTTIFDVAATRRASSVPQGVERMEAEARSVVAQMAEAGAKRRRRAAEVV